MLEIIMVLLLAGILTAVAASRLNTIDKDRIGEAERLKTNLRFAQYLAMINNTQTWAITLTSGSYTLMKDGSAAPVNFPNSNSPTRILAGGVTITAGTGTVTFDEWGSAGTTNSVITVSGSETITITRNTGFIA